MILQSNYRHILRTIFFSIIFIFINACDKQVPFDSESWKNAGGEAILTKERLLMTNDLLESKLLLNKSEKEVDSILGSSFRLQNSDSRKKYYMIQEIYSNNIDPDELIYFEIIFDYKGKSSEIKLKRD